MAVITGRACHVVFGFLGAGKTSLINACIHHHKPSDWAVLVNEIGQIGIDEQLFDSQVAVRQISGGCICCTSQLPLQVALVRLLAEHRPQRLWIEPTGLAHPKALLDELSAPHWQQSLSIKSVIAVLNAHQWQQIRYRHHDDYIAHIRYADVIVINRLEKLDSDEQNALMAWIKQHNESAFCVRQTTSDWLGELFIHWDKPSEQLQKLWQKQLSKPLSVPKNQLSPNTMQTTSQNDEPLKPPYCYHHIKGGVSVMGWCLPANAKVAIDELTDWLMTLDDWQRIKGVFLTTDGWQTLNFSPDSLSIVSKSIASQATGADNYLEMIFAKEQSNAYFEQLDEKLAVLVGCD